MKLILHTVVIKAPRHRVYDAVATRPGLAGWWTTAVTGESVVGGTLAFRFADVFKPDMRVAALEPDRRVHWTCIGGEPNWTDNAFIFDLTDENGMTTVIFRQEYARELDDETYGQYNYNWGYYLTSLKTLCETGTGAPFGRVSPKDANVAIARRLADEIFSNGDMRAFDELLADDYVNHNIPVPGVPGTKAGFKEVILATRTAFPDVHVNVKDVVAEGDFVVFRDVVTATSRGAFFGVPPNGKSLEWTEIHFLRIANGKIAEHWTNFDQVKILMQLGVIPS